MNDNLKAKLKNEILGAKTNLQLIVDSPFKFIEIVMLDLGVVVLLLEDVDTKTVNRMALSNTEPAAGALRATNKPFHKIKIPLSEKKNAIVKAIDTGEIQKVTDWKYLFIPELSIQEARDNQHSAGIMCSIVSPFRAEDKHGALIFSFLCPLSGLSDEHYKFIDGFTEIVTETI